MESVFIALFVVAAPPAVAAEGGSPAALPAAVLDVRCFQLMAELSDDSDPRIRSLGRVAAQYFLGRIDAAAPEFDVDATREAIPDRTALVRQCSQVMQQGGHDFRAIGESLMPEARPRI